MTFLLSAPLWSPRRAASRRLFAIGLAAYGLLSGSAGLLMLYLWLYTPHLDLHANGKLMLFPPTHLLLVPLGAVILRRGPISARLVRGVRIYWMISAGALLVNLVFELGPLQQDNTPFLLVATCLLTLAWRSSRTLGASSHRKDNRI